ncbi:MAG: glutamate--tRNA ligase family protein, partial [Asticcacaulis sp.]
MVFRTRFAPSPTGFLHLGHAFSAMTAYEAAQAEGGDFLLRIEDIDHTRCRPLFEQAIFDDLAWLGIDWPRPVLRQSEHIGDYQAALERLRDMGVVHADARTRRSTAEAALSAPQEGSPSGDASMDTAGPHPAWRLSLEEARRVLGARYDALSFTEGSIEQKAVPETNGD